MIDYDNLDAIIPVGHRVKSNGACAYGNRPPSPSVNTFPRVTASKAAGGGRRWLLGLV